MSQSATVMVQDAGGRTIVGDYATPVTLTDNDPTGATTIATSGGDSPPAGQLVSSSDIATFSYTGLAIASATIVATAASVALGTAQFTPLLQPIVTTAPLNQIALTGSMMTGSFTASEIGWTNPPYNRMLGIVTSGCATIGTVAPASGTAFTASTIASPVAGSCALTLTDFSGGSSHAVTLAFSGGSQIFGSAGTQTFTVPAGVTLLTLALLGGEGHGGGSGGSVTATIPVTPGESLQVNVGGAAAAGTGGFNGGANGNLTGCGSGGGGASDVRQGGTALVNRVAVAGGGGGGNCDNGEGGGHGGDAGGLTGGNGTNVNVAGGGLGGNGGTQGAGGAGGPGGTGTLTTGSAGTSGTLGAGGAGGAGGGSGLGAAGGGGGYYGGGGGGGGGGQVPASGHGGGGAGGGSSFAEPAATNVAILGGVNGSGGSITLSW